MISKSIKKFIKKIPFVKKKLLELEPDLEYTLQQILPHNDNLKVLDIGANTGQTIDFFLNTYRNPILYCFEPTPDLIQILLNKYKKNDDVHIYDIALGDTSGKIDFFISDFSPCNSPLRPNIEIYQKYDAVFSEKLEKTKKIQVTSSKLDDWYNETIPNEIIDVVKIDTQGYEYNVINGGINTLSNNVKILVFEVQYLDFYNNMVPFYKIFELLYDNNFFLYTTTGNNKKGIQLLENNVVFFNKRFSPVL